MTKHEPPLTKSWDNSGSVPNPDSHLDALNNAAVALIQLCISGSSNDDDTIVRSSQVLDCLSSSYASLLIARANAWERKGNFKQALTDALKAIDCQPTSAEGYLATGKVYSTHGYQQQAIAVYDRGLRAAFPSEWPLLYEKRDAAKKRMGQKIDFVSKLPAGVAVAIFEKIPDDSDTLIQCVSVSRLWRDCIVHQCPALWRHITISNESYNRAHSSSSLLPSISNHVQQLSLKDISEQNFTDLVRMAEEGSFPLVKEIEIVMSLRIIERYTPFVALIHRNLTVIKLQLESFVPDDHDQPLFELDTIMCLCARLEYLYLQSWHHIPYNPVNTPSSDGYRLLELSIDMPDVEGVLERLLPQCPRIQALSVNRLAPQIISFISQQCPRLRHFRHSFGRYQARKIRSNTDNDQDPSGLYTLHYYTESDTFVQDYMEFFTKSKGTLKELRLAIQYVNKTIALDAFSQLGFSYLRVLYLKFVKCNGYFTKAAASLIQQSPMLEDVKLVFMDDEAVLNQFFTCFHEHSHLRKFSIRGFNAPASGLAHFFAHHAAEIRTLQYIRIELCDDATTDEVLAALADITALQKLELWHTFTNVSTDGVRTFIRKLQALAHLSSLWLVYVPQITDDILVQLTGIDGLECLDLGTLENIKPDGVYQFARKLPRSLKKVLLYDCDAIGTETKQYLKEKLYANNNGLSSQ